MVAKPELLVGSWGAAAVDLERECRSPCVSQVCRVVGRAAVLSVCVYVWWCQTDLGLGPTLWAINRVTLAGDLVTPDCSVLCICWR